ncbi:MAG: NitT/TauT family transport system substrate-binding protein [Alphaproteobacteria bacterium]|nr:NitT/TauT family transport system substrate-binding protein [Alphaproteobacteria bacterium]
MSSNMQSSRRLTRRAAIASAVATGIAVGLRPVFAQSLKTLEIAEPVHNLGYAPVYLAAHQGFFKSRGLDVSMLQATNGSHVTALVSGQVWGNIGGPESDAMANVGKADPLKTICNLVNRANLYLVARKGLAPKSSSKADLAAFFKGKKFALGRYGGTPDLLARWLVVDIGLDPNKDIEPVNQADMAAVLAMVKNGVVDMAITQEPFITAGVEQGLWDQPFYSYPALGDYPYSVVSVRQSTITSEPQIVQAFVDAVLQALSLATKDRAAIEAMTRKEFPTLSQDGVKATLDRIYADKIWSTDGVVSEQGYARDMDVVARTGAFTKSVPYGDVVDMQFVRKALEKR